MPWSQFFADFQNPTDPRTVLLNLGLVIVLGQILAWHYLRFSPVLSNKRKFARVFVFIAATTMLVIAVVQRSTALSLDKDVFEHHGSYGVLLEERSVEERAKFHFYLARTYAKAGMNERALQYIRKALEEGFKEKKKLMEEPEFEALRELPEFKELMALEPRVL